ncbi:hypothetical protein [Pseudodesulfovibrio sp.]|uniref:hypothetical protein n=1 Tax=unclassified Pseudodesulfovibrio TaxID=2661612 RepID=UPI003AFFCB7A
MAQNFKQNMNRELLEELLRDVDDPNEAEALRRTWEATACLQGAAQPAPAMSGELATALGRVDEPLSDDELDMLAAAGTYIPGSDNDDTL